MIRRTVFGLLLACTALAWLAPAAVGGEAADRLDRFRQLAAARLGALELSGHDLSAEGLREIYALLDDEIVENLASGSLFASEAFLQERLDAFNEAWGGAAFRILVLPGSVAVGGFQLSPGGQGNSVRIYTRDGLARAIHREGVPVLQEMPATRTGEPQFLAAWSGPQSSRGSTAFRLELWRRQGEAVRLAWSTDALGADGLLVSGFSLRGQEVSFRYEVRYPGWKPGCDGQTEHEDLYRYVPARESFALARRRVHNGWHREFHADLAGFLRSLNARDARALAQLVPDGSLRARLPDRLEADLACDEADGARPATVSFAAVSPAGGRPWTLVFHRTAAGWRLVTASPAE